MKKKNKFTKGVKTFFKSLGEDILSLFTKHWLKLVGYTISFIIPLASMIGFYLKKKPESWSMPILVWLPIAMLLLIYWIKVKGFINKRIGQMELENSIQKGKHAGALILATTIQMAMTVAPFLACYYVFGELAKASIKVQDVFLFLTVCEAVGGIFIILDVAINSLKTDDESDETEKTE